MREPLHEYNAAANLLDISAVGGNPFAGYQAFYHQNSFKEVFRPHDQNRR
jgi:hypothetical protein